MLREKKGSKICGCYKRFMKLHEQAKRFLYNEYLKRDDKKKITLFKDIIYHPAQ